MTKIRIVATVATALASALPVAAFAQAWPTRPVTMVVPFPPGAVSDGFVRILQTAMEGPLGQPIVVENRGGAAGVTGLAGVSRAEPDGYTLAGTVNAPLVMSPWLMSSYPMDPAKAISGVIKVGEAYLALAVRKDSPIKTVADVIRMAKEQPGKLTFGSAGVGSAHHISGELMNKSAGIQLVHVPFQGGGPAIQALLAGHINMSFGTISSMVSLLESGDLRLVAMSEPKRIDAFPNVPTISETLPGVETTSWLAILAPGGTPKAVKDKFYNIASAALKKPDVIDRITKLGVKITGEGPEELDAIIARDLKFWQAAVAKAEIPKQ